MALIVAALCLLGADDDPYARAREAMIEEITDDVRATRHYLDQDSLSETVLEAMRQVPRHWFVPKEQLGAAYENRPLPIGHGQTISQPYIVAIMTELLRPSPVDRALEIGTGSGYQAAVLSRLVDEVFSIEIIEALGTASTRRLAHHGFDNVRTRIADGYYGWKSQAPFDVIIVTAAGSHVPPPLIAQLAPGGRLIIPVGSRFLVQNLVLIEKSANGDITTRQILPVRFVPLTGGHD